MGRQLASVTERLERASSKSDTARGRVREDVRRLILSGELKPGTRLKQQHLAKHFGVAQSVVRESLLELQLTGLVRTVDNLGIFVSELDGSRLLQAYEVREMLEGLAARLCCERAGRGDVTVLTEMVDRIYTLGISGHDQERGALDRDFHFRIIQTSGNLVLQRLTQAYHALGMVVQASRPHQMIRDEHARIVRAIGDGACDEAERAAREHVAGAREALRQQMAAGAFAPRWVVD